MRLVLFIISALIDAGVCSLLRIANVWTVDRGHHSSNFWRFLFRAVRKITPQLVDCVDGCLFMVYLLDNDLTAKKVV